MTISSGRSNSNKKTKCLWRELVLEFMVQHSCDLRFVMPGERLRERVTTQLHPAWLFLQEQRRTTLLLTEVRLFEFWVMCAGWQSGGEGGGGLLRLEVLRIDLLCIRLLFISYIPTLIHLYSYILKLKAYISIQYHACTFLCV